MARAASIPTGQSKCSEEYSDNVCSSCLKKNKHTEGEHNCMECQDYHRSKCVEIHKDYPALSSHTIIGKPDSKYKELAESFKPVPTERCPLHTTKLVDMYCTAHKKVGCGACMTLEHTSCRLLYVPDAIDNIMKTFDMRRFIEDCRAIRTAAIERIQIIEEQTKALNIKRDYAMKELKEFKNALIYWLDTIEESTVKNLENACAQLEFKWTDEISKLKKCK